MGGFGPLVELHREGSAPAACAAGLFINSFINLFILSKSIFKTLSLPSRKIWRARIWRHCSPHCVYHTCVKCQVSYVTCHMSGVICHMSNVRCHFMYKKGKILFLQNGGDRMWRVDYQWGYLVQLRNQGAQNSITKVSYNCLICK